MALEYGQGGGISVKMAGPLGGGGGGSNGKMSQVALPASAWKGAESPFSQEVAIDAVSANSIVELRPTIEQIEQMLDFAITINNNGGVTTAYAIGRKPEQDLSLAVSVTEVTV